MTETETNDKNDIRFDSGFQDLDSDSIRLFFNYFLYVRFDSVFFPTILYTFDSIRFFFQLFCIRSIRFDTFEVPFGIDSIRLSRIESSRIIRQFDSISVSDTQEVVVHAELDNEISSKLGMFQKYI